MNTSPEGNEITKLMESWVKTASSFWQDRGSEQQEAHNRPATGPNFQESTDSDENDKYKTYKTWETSVNNFTAFLKMMATPENQEALRKSASSYAEAMVQATGDSLESTTDFQTQLVNTFAKVGEHTTAYNFDDLDHSSFESFRELYKSELQKYLYIPKLGLERESHEQMSRLIDRSNIFNSHLFELIYLFLLPFEKTNRGMQEKVKQQLENGEVVEDVKQTYSEWVKVLEGHYMELLKSSAFTTVLDNTINSFADYKNIKQDMMNSFLKEQQIPTNKDMDEVYRDLYQTKKKLAELTRQVAALQTELKSLTV